MSDKIKEFYSSDVRDPNYVLNKLKGYANRGDLLKMVCVAVIRTEDGKGAEVLIGTDGIDRYDLLSAAQQLRISADAMYRLMVESGLEYATSSDNSNAH